MRTDRARHDSGSAILEMAIVFPVIVLVLIIMLFFGMLLYEQVATQAIMGDVCSKAAANWATAEHGLEWELPTGASHDATRVYWRLLDGQTQAKRAEVERTALGRLRQACIFKDTFRAEDVRCEVSGNPVYRTIRLDVERTFALPFGALLTQSGFDAQRRYRLRAVAVVQDAPEMIRNIDFAHDIAKKTGLKKYMDKLGELSSRIQAFFKTLKIDT